MKVPWVIAVRKLAPLIKHDKDFQNVSVQQGQQKGSTLIKFTYNGRPYAFEHFQREGIGNTLSLMDGSFVPMHKKVLKVWTPNYESFTHQTLQEVKKIL
jgi:hypothetical protein